MSTKRLLMIVIALAAISLGSRAIAAGHITITLGHAQPLMLAKPIHRLAIGDPARLATVLISSQEVLLTGVGAGRTNLLVWYEDGGRDEFEVLVERDLTLLRGRLGAIDPAIVVETSADGGTLVLSGSVDGPAEAGIAVMFTAQFGGVIEKGHTSEVIAVRGTSALSPAASSVTADVLVPEGPADVRGVINLLRYRTLLRPLDERLAAAMHPFAPDLTVRRLLRGGLKDDARDTFLIEGRVATQAAYFKALSVADRMLGGNGAQFFPIADPNGGPPGNTLGAGGGGAGASTLSGGGVSALGGGAGVGAGVGAGGGSSGGLQVGGGRLGRGRQAGGQIMRGLGVASPSNRLLSYAVVTDQPQVLVAVRLIEIDRSRSLTIGVDSGAAVSNFAQGAANAIAPGIATGFVTPIVDKNGSVVKPAVVPPGPGTNLAGALSVINGQGGGQFGLVRSRFAFETALTLLQTEGIARSLAEPNLLALSGETASFQVGDTVGVPVGSVLTSTGFAAQTVETFDLGVTLSVRPVVGEDGTITIDLLPEVSSNNGPAQSSGTGGTTGGSSSTTSNGILFDFTTKNLQTTARLREGEGLVIGGLIQRTKSYDVRKVPILGDIPLLGVLFRTTVETEDEKELAFAVFPRVLRPRDELLFRVDLPPEDAQIRAGTYVEGDLGILRERRVGIDDSKGRAVLPPLPSGDGRAR